MATLSQAESRRMYSWWWDSHISPKNSKWLQENLTDIDSKVKAMVKIIEEDADSFARRAEMYYKKRPELMKLVEEFYRAYRALAERYDHATGALRQAHRTMAEAFPNQIPFGPADESPGNSASEADPRTPEMSTHVRAMFDPEDLQKDALGLSSPHFNKKNGAFTQESDSVTSRKGLKQLNDLFGSGGHAKFAEGKVRKVLNFQEAGENETGAEINENLENEILNLKEALAKLEAEKDSALIQHRQSLERFSNLEAEFSRVQEDSKDLSKQASEAEAEVQNLKEALSRLEAEKEASLMQYQECLEKVSNLEITLSDAQKDIVELNEQASKGATEAQSLKQDLAKLETEKNAALDQYKQFLDMISDLQNKLLHTEEGASKLRERAEKAESEVETLKQAINKLTEEKEAAALQYQQCLETISSLEHDLSFAQDEAQRLNGEIDNGVAKLKGTEEQCLLLERSKQSLHSELESLSLKMGAQSQELTEKQKELGRVWTCLQEERLRYIDAETAFQTLQRLHSQAQEELRFMASELENKAQVLSDMETRNQSLQCEILKLMEENKSLNEINLTSAMSMKDIQNEIFSLRETKGKLEEEVELRVDQRNALQQEIYCLKEELNDLNKKYLAISEQVDALGLNPESFKSSVNELRNANKYLKETCEIERNDKLALLEKLEIMEQLLEKNALLENSLSDLGAELEGVRGKIKALGESCDSLLEEKSMLVDEKAALLTQLQVTTDNLGEKNTVLENSLSDAYDELEVLKEKSKSLEDSCLLLINEKSSLISEKNTLISQMEITQQILKDLEEKFAELEEKYLALEKEKKSTLCKVEELKICLDVQKQEHVGFVQMSETRLAGMETQIHLLQEESQHINKELGEELDKALDSQIETFVLQGCVQDLKEKNFSLSIECQKLLEASELSTQLISEFERENLKQQLEVKSLFDQNNTWRIGMHQLSKALGVVLDDGHENKNGLDQTCLYNMMSKVQDIEYSLCEAQDENQQWAIELSVLVTLLGHLKSEVSKLEIEKNTIDQNLTIRTEQFLAEESRVHKLLEVTEDLRSKVEEGDHREEVLTTQIKNSYGKVLDVQGAYEISQKEKAQVLEEKLSLTKEFLLMEDSKRIVEEENCAIFGEMLSMSNLSLIFKNYGNEKSMELKELGEDLDKLQGVNVILQEKLSIMERKLAEVQMENLNLKETLQKSEHELIAVTFVSDQLNYEIVNGKNLLQQKEKELLETEQKLSGTENEKSKLRKIVEDLKRKCHEVEITREDQEKQITELKVELLQLHEEHEKRRNREENLSSQLQKGNNEIEMWETQAASFYGDLQTSTLVQALFQEKVHELTEACEGLQDENCFRVADIELLKERVHIVEGENEGLKAQLAPYAPAIISLRDSISSLENHICLHTNLQNSDSKEEKVTDLANGVHVEGDLNEEQKATVLDACSDLQDLQTRVKAIERSVIEIKTLVMQGNVKPTSEILEVEIGLLTKDIVLDQISESSSHGISSREHAESDNQMLELWETAHQDGNIDLTVTKGKKVDTSPTEKDIKYHRVEAVKQKNKYPISDFAVEKDLSVDKLEILSKRFTEPRQEGNKRKILERLNSDVQKLTNLQITVQDLKKKVEIIENNRRGKPVVECDSLKRQLEEAEDAILKLFDLNGKLMKNFEDDNSFSSDKKSAIESEEIGSVSRRRTSEQARRASEKIGRLQLEVQKIQFVLLKLDVEKDGSARGRILDSKRSVLLRDYLYGGGVRKISHKKKKAPFCACIQPPTKGD